MTAETFISFLVMKCYRALPEEEIERILWIRPSLRGLNASRSNLPVIGQLIHEAAECLSSAAPSTSILNANIRKICTSVYSCVYSFSDISEWNWWSLCAKVLPPSHTPWPSLLGGVLFVGWRYYISSYSLSSLSVFQLLLWLHKRRVLAVLVSVQGWVYSSEVWEGKQYVHHRLPVRSLLLEGVCLPFADRLSCQTDRFVLSAQTATKETEGRKCQECLRTTREHFRFRPTTEVQTLTFVLSLHLPHTPKQLFFCWPNVLACSTFQPSSPRWNRGSFSLLTSVWLSFWVWWCLCSSAPPTSAEGWALASCFRHESSVRKYRPLLNLPIAFSRGLFLLQNTHPLVCDSESDTAVWMREQGLKVT